MAEHVPVVDVSMVLKILPVAEGRRSSRRTATGVSFTITQPLASYLADPSHAGMGRCADSDAAVFDALMISRWRIPAPPPLDLPPAEDAPSWTRLGRLLIGGEEPHHVIDLWRRGELPES
ncbi:hypothetical protein [Lapillicoccus jejuensis]|uniref:hypothetical protein n=1 Tax=Lapillicoccus jejuensis TaxID=402171 RepID=UPI001153776D|nr:hypothetical protein [Lapillicoccus jejuensis]